MGSLELGDESSKKEHTGLEMKQPPFIVGGLLNFYFAFLRNKPVCFTLSPMIFWPYDTVEPGVSNQLALCV